MQHPLILGFLGFIGSFTAVGLTGAAVIASTRQPTVVQVYRDSPVFLTEAATPVARRIYDVNFMRYAPNQGDFVDNCMPNRTVYMTSMRLTH